MTHAMNGPLLLRELIPPVTARTADGKTIRAWDYKQKRPLVITFVHADCAHCDRWLEQLAARAADLIEREGVVLVIYAEPAPRKTESFPSPLIAAFDATGHSQRAFLGREAFSPAGLDRVGVFVTDRYGELYGQWLGRDAAELPAPGEILGTLDVIQMIC
jgi:peroxiredoxin